MEPQSLVPVLELQLIPQESLHCRDARVPVFVLRGSAAEPSTRLLVTDVLPTQDLKPASSSRSCSGCTCPTSRTDRCRTSTRSPARSVSRRTAAPENHAGRPEDAETIPAAESPETGTTPQPRTADTSRSAPSTPVAGNQEAGSWNRQFPSTSGSSLPPARETRRGIRESRSSEECLRPGRSPRIRLAS